MCDGYGQLSTHQRFVLSCQYVQHIRPSTRPVVIVVLVLHMYDKILTIIADGDTFDSFEDYAALALLVLCWLEVVQCSVGDE